MKNRAASSLAKIRWAKTTPQERIEHARKMGLASGRKRRKMLKKLCTGELARVRG